MFLSSALPRKISGKNARVSRKGIWYRQLWACRLEKGMWSLRTRCLYVTVWLYGAFEWMKVHISRVVWILKNESPCVYCAFWRRLNAYCLNGWRVFCALVCGVVRGELWDFRKPRIKSPSRSSQLSITAEMQLMSGCCFRHANVGALFRRFLR